MPLININFQIFIFIVHLFLHIFSIQNLNFFRPIKKINKCGSCCCPQVCYIIYFTFVNWVQLSKLSQTIISSSSNSILNCVLFSVLDFMCVTFQVDRMTFNKSYRTNRRTRRVHKPWLGVKGERKRKKLTNLSNETIASGTAKTRQKYANQNVKSSFITPKSAILWNTE